MSGEQQIWLVVVFAQFVVLGLLLLTRMQRMDAEPRPDLRDYFAAKAMQADLTGHIGHYGHESHWPVDQMASHAYEVADAMLKARQA